jgi:TPR repeat protein
MTEKEVAAKLSALIQRYGTSLCSEPKRLEALLRDYCPQNKREVNVLLIALREQVPAELLSSSIPLPLLQGRLVTRLQENIGLADTVAQWAVEAWIQVMVPNAEGTNGLSSFVSSSSELVEQGRTAELAGDYANAVTLYHQAAEAGNADGMTNLGALYQNGRGVAQSDTEAVVWFRKAAEAGNASGMSWLGWMYQNGRGVAQSDVEAVAWYRKAAEAGNADAMNWLGWMHENGRGVTRNMEEAVAWYRKAAEKGSKEAAEALQRLNKK